MEENKQSASPPRHPKSAYIFDVIYAMEGTKNIKMFVIIPFLDHGLLRNATCHKAVKKRLK